MCLIDAYKELLLSIKEVEDKRNMVLQQNVNAHLLIKIDQEYKLKKSIENAQSIDIIVSFLMKSGVKLILNELDSAIKKGVSSQVKQAKEYKKFIGYAKMGVEYQIDMSLFESINEARLDPKQLLQQLGGNRFIMMVGAKNLAIDKPKT